MHRMFSRRCSLLVCSLRRRSCHPAQDRRRRRPALGSLCTLGRCSSGRKPALPCGMSTACPCSPFGSCTAALLRCRRPLHAALPAGLLRRWRRGRLSSPPCCCLLLQRPPAQHVRPAGLLPLLSARLPAAARLTPALSRPPRRRLQLLGAPWRHQLLRLQPPEEAVQQAGLLCLLCLLCLLHQPPPRLFWSALPHQAPPVLMLLQ